MAKVVDSQLPLEAICGESSGVRGHPSIIDDHVELGRKFQDLFAELFYRSPIAKVKIYVVNFF